MSAGAECPDGLSTPMAVPGEKDLEDWALDAITLQGHKPGTLVLLLGGWGLFLSVWLSQQRCLTSYMAAPGSQECRNGSFNFF